MRDALPPRHSLLEQFAHERQSDEATATVTKSFGA
jgi:hypothetical protein